VGSESTLRKKLVALLRTVNAIAVENRVGPGTPDMCIVTLGIWIEVKRTMKFPVRDGIVRLDHELLPSQKVWLNRCHRRGGKAYVLTQVANEFFLHDGPWASEFLGKVDRSLLAACSQLHCVGWADLGLRLLPFLVNNA